MIKFNQIIDPIEKAVISWTQLYPLLSPAKTLNDLTNAQFFILHLNKIQSFKFIEPCAFDFFTQLSISQKIARMKFIGKSIIKHYKCQLMKDMGDTHFNYVEMCTENKEEIMRMLIMFMGIIVNSQSTLQQLQSYIAAGKEDSLSYLNIMIDYAKKMNYRQQQTTESSPVKKQKRLITKLEILEEQIEFYEEYTKQLQLKLEQFSEDAIKHEKTIAQDQARRQCMLRRIEQLQLTNEQMLKEVSKRSSNQALLSAKLSKNRQLADESIERLLKDFDKLKEQLTYYKETLIKYEHIQSINKHLSQVNSDLNKQLLALRTKIDKNLDTLSKKDKQLQSIGKINNSLILQNDSLKVKIDLIQKSFAKNRQISFEPQQKSIVIHNPLNLSSSSQNNFTWFNFQSNLDDEAINDSLTLTLKSNHSFSQHPKNCQQNKQNEMTLGNLMEGQLNKICEQKSFQLNMDHINLLMKCKQQRDFQLQFSIQIISQIYDYMQDLRKQLKQYQMKEARQLQRKMLFSTKVNTMFR